MGRKQRKNQLLKRNLATAKIGAGPRSRRTGRLALLLAVAGATTYLVRRNQRKAELDEGIWHEAPAPAPTAPSTPAPTAGL